MIILITDGIRIDGSDGRNWTLQQKRVRGPEAKNPGEAVWDDDGHYPSLMQACRRLLDRGLVQGQQAFEVGLVIEAIEAYTVAVRQAIERSAPLSGRVLDPVKPPPRKAPPVPPKSGRRPGR